MREELTGPAVLAALILFGLFFFQSLAFFADQDWNRGISISLHVFNLLFLTWITIRRVEQLLAPNHIDILFVLFCILVSVSLAAGGVTNGTVERHAQYLIPLTIAPYLCGRQMQAPDLRALRLAIVFSGTAALILLLTDRLTSPASHDVGRWPFFGLDHSPLLGAAILTLSLLGVCSLLVENVAHHTSRTRSVYQFIGLSIIVSVFSLGLIWLTARGWLIAALIGIFVMMMLPALKHNRRRLLLMSLVTSSMVVGFATIPNIDSYAAHQYQVPMGLNAKVSVVPESLKNNFGVNPILPKENCLGLASNNSVAIRWLLYNEAFKQFLAEPITGVGAARFGLRSCGAPSTHPHSIFLQALAELGVMGGVLLALIAYSGTKTLVHAVVRKTPVSELGVPYLFLLSALVANLVAAQIYGNYFTTSAFWLFTGISASCLSQRKKTVT